MNDVKNIWHAKRVKLERVVVDAALNLFQHMGPAAAFKIPIPNTDPILYVIAGDWREPTT